MTTATVRSEIWLSTRLPDYCKDVIGCIRYIEHLYLFVCDDQLVIDSENHDHVFEWGLECYMF